MPKMVDVRLDRISADFFPPDTDRRVEIQGRVFGTTFNKDPFEEKSRKDIYTFPDGPITIAHGQTVEIPLSNLVGGEDVRFLMKAFGLEGRIQPEFLNFGGELDNFADGFKELHTNFLVAQDEPIPHRVEIKSGDQEIRLDFTVTVDGFF